MLLGALAGVLAPAGLLLLGLTGHSGLHPVGTFVALALGGVVVFTGLGLIVGRRDEALVARNQELQRLSQEFKKLSSIDALTGIANRRGFDERLQIELDRSSRYGPPCSLVMIDLDRFKTVNDRFGHRGGDQILRRAAALLDSEKRSGDLLARYGGEEFAAIFPHVDGQAALAWAERMSLRLAAERLVWGDIEMSITASFGVASMPSHARTASELVEAADRALYEAKRGGGNRAVVACSRNGAGLGRGDRLALLGSPEAAPEQPRAEVD
jgi:diguanylate cyclase (GGDEF)-like protein